MELKVGIQRKVLTPKMAVFEPTTSRKQFLPEKKARNNHETSMS